MKEFSVERELSGETAARENPDKYPGWWPSQSFVIHVKKASAGPELFYLKPPTLGFQNREAKSQDLSSFRAGHLEVFSASNHGYHGSLNQFLRDRGLAPMEQRVPVLAVGSNASPSQLAHKFKHAGLSGTIPTIRVSVAGHGVGFVPGVSKFGYVPATLISRAGLNSELFLQFLDANQLVVMDESEGVNSPPGDGGLIIGTSYDRDPLKTNLVLPHGEQIGLAYAYVARSGYLAINGKPVLCDNSEFGRELPQDERPVVNQTSENLERCSSQKELIDLVGKHDKELALKLGKALQDRKTADTEWINGRFTKFSTPKNIHSEPNDPLSATYQEVNKDGWRFKEFIEDTLRKGPERAPGQSKSDKSGREDTFTALPTPNYVERKGESVVILHPLDFARLGEPAYVSVSSEPISQALTYQQIRSKRPPEAIARVQLADVETRKMLEKTSKSVMLDEVLRVAIGLYVGEKVQIKRLVDPRGPIRQAWFKVLKFVLGSPNYVSNRVVLSNVTTMERDVALVTPLTMQMLGIESGDFAVMEGVNREASEPQIKTVSVRVFPVDEKTLEKREKSQVGGWLSLVPDAKICLGVHTDLAPIFIDAALRDFLFGKNHGQSVGVIRLRASFPEKVSSEIRELLVVILLAVLAWVLTVPDEQLPLFWKSAFLLTTVLATFVLILLRIRNRSRHTKRSRKPKRKNS